MGSNGEGVSDDERIGAFDDARDERGDKATRADARGFPVAPSGGGPAAADGERAHGRTLSQDQAELVEELLLGVQRTEWAGPLPPPETLYAYAAEDQRKIIAWSDALILDESARSDKLVHAVIEATRREQWFAFLSAILPTLAAFVAFIATENPLSLSLLAIPTITIVVNVINAVRSGGGSDR